VPESANPSDTMRMSKTTTLTSKTDCERNHCRSSVSRMFDAKYATTYNAALVGFWSGVRLNTTRYEVAMMRTHRRNSTACGVSGASGVFAETRTSLTAFTNPAMGQHSACHAPAYASCMTPRTGLGAANAYRCRSHSLRRCGPLTALRQYSVGRSICDSRHL